MNDDLPLLVEAAREAGALMLEMRAGVHARAKSDGSPVTEADLAVDALLKLRLLAARPDYGWLSEETADDPARLRRRRVFVVDPIDGTTAYIKDRPWFCTALAVVDDGVVTHAAIHAPQTQELFAASLGGGATRNGAPIRAAGTARLEAARVCGDATLLGAPPWPQLDVVKRNAIAYRMALTAAGEVDATVSPTPKWEWDIAAGALIAGEAGCAVTDANGEALRFNGSTARLPGLVCCAPGLLSAILQRTSIPDVLIQDAGRPMPRAV